MTSNSLSPSQQAALDTIVDRAVAKIDAHHVVLNKRLASVLEDEARRLRCRVGDLRPEYAAAVAKIRTWSDNSLREWADEALQVATAVGIPAGILSAELKKLAP